MKRYVAALLVGLGLVGVVGVLAVGTGFANDEKAAGAKCSEATLHGTYLFAQNGVEIKGNCTGTVTFRDGATIQGDIFIAPDGSKFAFVRTDPEFVGASIDEQVTAKRVGE